MKGPHRVAIYARVSTAEQNVDVQLDELRQAVNQRGWRRQPTPLFFASLQLVETFLVFRGEAFEGDGVSPPCRELLRRARGAAHRRAGRAHTPASAAARVRERLATG